MLRPSVVCNVCIVAKRCVLVQKVLSLPIVSRRRPRRLYEDLICTKINDLDLCLEVEKVTSNSASRSPLNISVNVRDRGLVPEDHQ